MSSETEDFESLRRLLALKKHEKPPLGYFETFASRVRSGIVAAEVLQSNWWLRVGEEASWLKRMWTALTKRPAFAAAFGVVVCGMVFGGIYFTQKPNVEASTTLAESLKIQTPSPAALPVGHLASPQILASSSTNPVIGASGSASLFDQIGVPSRPAAVSFSQP